MALITTASGDKVDILGRLRALLPPWFTRDAELVSGTLQGYANAAAFVFGLYVYAKLQTRVRTATDGWLDMIAADFFGSSLSRKAGQGDDSFRVAILNNLLRERAPHAAMTKALKDLTGRTPRVIELQRPLDTGAYGYLFGYGQAGAYGTAGTYPYQAFVTAYRPLAGSGYIATDADIYAAVEAVKPAVTLIWTAISA
jgi:hypothetical protein